MKEAQGGVWLFGLVIMFIFLFVGFICLTLNRTKVSNIKDQVLEIIERHGGIDLTASSASDDEALEEIVNYMKTASYNTVGNCSGDYTGFTKDGTASSTSAIICIKEVQGYSDAADLDTYNELPNMAYYSVMVFYQLDLPIFNSVFKFAQTGETRIMPYS